MRLELGPFVEGDLEEIGDFIALDNPGRAVSFVREIRERFRVIAENPLIFRLHPEIGEDARLLPHGRYVIRSASIATPCALSASPSVGASFRNSTAKPINHAACSMTRVAGPAVSPSTPLIAQLRS